jgi:hypothetical protein
VDKWIGVIEGAQLGDWKAERHAAIEGKPLEDSLRCAGDQKQV